MQFNEIIESIITEISSISKFSYDEIKMVFMKYRDLNRSDFCLFLNKISKTPEEDAEELAKALVRADLDLVEKVRCEKTLVSFNLNKRKVYRKILARINNEDENFGKNENGKNKKVVVDFSSPNIAKVFHVGHFRTTVLGNFIVNLLRCSSYDVVAMNYLGDWGKQFGLVLLAYERYGDKDELNNDPLNHLCNLYVRINKEAETDESINSEAKEIFREMEENSNEKYMKEWRRFREISIKKYAELYENLNIRFDVYSGESFYNEGAKTFARTNNICVKDPDGSYVIDLGGLGNALIQKSDGTTLYLARDIVAAIDRIKTYDAHELIYVVADEQNMHFRQLFETLKMMGYDQTKFRHINYGMIQKMSTREGTVHFLEDVLKISADAVKKNILSNPAKTMDDSEKDEISRILAVSTLLIADFSAKRIKGYVFDIEKRANCESGSGAYLQYAHCRLKSMEIVNSGLDMSNLSEEDFEFVDHVDVHDLAYKLLWYEQIVELCLEDFEPSRIVLYLMDLAKTANNLVKKLKVKGEEEKVAKARLGLFRAVRIVFQNAFKVLGLIPLTKM